jgi:N-acyl-D-amino-acid deacylase
MTGVRAAVACAAVGLALCLDGSRLAGAPGQNASRFDLIVAGGTIVDGSGDPRTVGDVGIKDGRIAVIGRLPRSQAAQVIDAAGLVVAPGFVDVHTHAENIVDHPAASNFVRMGVTTVVAGNCGTSAIDVAAALAELRDEGIAINYATLIGHNTVRAAVMGNDDRAPWPSELARMKSLVWKAMADGAVGFSTGLQYVPGTYAHAAEIIELARVTANAGGIYASHMRNEGTGLEAAIAETIRAGDAAGARVEISHLKVDSPKDWGASAKALALIDAARASGIDVEADQYAYTAASSGISVRFPSWVLEGGDAKVSERLNNPRTWDRIKTEMIALLADRGLHDLSFAVVAMYRRDPSLNGLSLAQVAAKRAGTGGLDAQLEAARELLLDGGAQMVYHLMSDDDVDRIMRHPQVAVASDSSVLAFGEGVPHPRGYGDNARVLGTYVRGRHVLRLEDAVRKMTSLPAAHFHFANRGLIRAGYAADLVVFDPARVGDPATYEKPHAYADGIPFVIVNGTVVVRNGVQTAARPGQVIAHSLLERSTPGVD